MATFQSDAKDLAHHIVMTVSVKRMGQWLWRVKIAKFLIRLAACVMWVNVEIEDD